MFLVSLLLLLNLPATYSYKFPLLSIVPLHLSWHTWHSLSMLISRTCLFKIISETQQKIAL